MSKAKFILSTAALIGLTGVVACSHSQKRSNVDASASAPAVSEPSVASATTTDDSGTTSSTAPTDLGASTSGRGL